MKLRTWVNIITVVLLGLAIYFSRHQLVQAWELLSKVDLLIYALLIPIQFFSYYAVGEVMFSYLRAKGELQTMSRWKMSRIALELNFVNHIIPIPSIAGFSYLGWVLGHHGVSAGRATMAQIIRYATMFMAFVVMIVLSIIVLFFDVGVDKKTIFISEVLVAGSVISMTTLIYFIGSRKRLVVMARWFTNFVNKCVRFVTFGRKRRVLVVCEVEEYLLDLHQDYLEIKKDKKILIKPLVWAIVANTLDVALISVAFLALGAWVDPAVLFVAYGIAAFSAIFAATPGGTGVYEAIMIAFLASAGVPGGLAIAGTLLARVTLFAGTIIFGFIFYQLTINKHGKVGSASDI